MHDAETKERQQRANQILDELKAIRESGMTDRDILNEMHLRNVKVNIQENLQRQLALARVGIITPAASTSSVENDEIEEAPISEVVSHFVETFDRFKNTVNETSTEMDKFMKNVTSSVNFIPDMENFSRSTIGLTDAEKAAMRIISEGQDENGYYNPTKSAASTSSDSGSGRQEGRDGKGQGTPPRAADRLSERDIESILQEVEDMKTFDEVVRWAIKYPRPVLAQILRFRGEPVPKQAPRSTLAGILADSIIVEKRERGQIVADEEGFDRDQLSPVTDTEEEVQRRRQTGGSGVPGAGTGTGTRKRPPSAVGPTTVRIPPSPVYKGPQASAGAAAAGAAAARAKARAKDYSFEKDIFTRFLDTMKSAIDAFIDNDQIPSMPRMMPNLTELPSITLVTTLNLIMFSTYSVLHGTIVSFAKWAGGKVLPTHYIVFFVSAYCIALKKGLGTFFSSFLAIRMFRAFWGILSAVTGFENSVADNEEDETAF
jgi:hypothetical protein